MKGGLQHILIKDSHDRLAAPKGRDMVCVMRISRLLIDGMLHVVETKGEKEDEEDEEDESEAAQKRAQFDSFLGSYMEYTELDHLEAPTGEAYSPHPLRLTPHDR